MSPVPLLYLHPFSAYCWKVLIALYQNETPFEARLLDDRETWVELKALWPLGKMPVLVDGDQMLAEASIIVEYLALYHSGPIGLIPSDPARALRSRFFDRVFDNYISTPMQKIVGDFLRPETERDPRGVADARSTLYKAYRWVDANIPKDSWAMGESFTLADCAAAPALFYADWAHPIPEEFANVRAYRRRLLAHPPIARVVDEARPYRKLFPPGAADRD